MIHRYFRAARRAVACCVLCTNTHTALTGSSPFVEEVETFAFDFCPLGWAKLNGQLLLISQNTALFSLLGTTYGGDGVTTFAVPTAKPISQPSARSCSSASLCRGSSRPRTEQFIRTEALIFGPICGRNI
jgi:hypothetical protein